MVVGNSLDGGGKRSRGDVQKGLDHLAIVGGEVSTELISNNNNRDIKVTILIYTHRGGAEMEQVLGAKGGNGHGGGSRKRGG